MKIKRKFSVFTELALVSLIIISIILILNSAIQLISFSIFSNRYEKEHLVNRYNEISTLSRKVKGNSSDDWFKDYLNEVTKTERNQYIRIYSKENIYYVNEDKIWSKVDFDNSNQWSHVDLKLINFRLHRVLTSSISIGNENFNIQIIQENNLLNEFIENYIDTLPISIILGVILSIIGAIYVSRTFLKRLKVLTNTMNEIKAKGIKSRAEISDRNDEFDKVNIIFNSMMDEVEESFNEQSRFVSDASHELKTPLTALQGHLTMLKRWGKNDEERLEKSLDICLSEVERLKKIVNDLLILSKVEKSNIDLGKIEKINIVPIVESVIEQNRVIKDDVKYSILLQNECNVKVKENDLKQLLIIFIDNAIKYNDKKNIEIKISSKEEKEMFTLVIKDNGIGIPKKEIRNVVKRFYKVDKSRKNNNSFGIGLSIADRIIKKYNGQMIIKSKVGEYTEILVKLPK